MMLGILLYWLVDHDRLERFNGAVHAVFSSGAYLDQDRFQAKALHELNAIRSQLELTALISDPELDWALHKFVQAHPHPAQINLDTLFKLLRDIFPGAQFISATVVLDNEIGGVISDLREWGDVINGDYESIATFVFKDGTQFGCLAVLTRRLPSFDLATANRDGGRFFNTCPRCENVHAIELGKQSQTLILSCPGCSRPYDVLASDVGGQYRRAPEFLDGSFRIAPGGPVKSLEPKARLRRIWASVLERCHSRAEAWKTPAETWNDKSGDCEDTAILLADILISTGFDARVAVGWNIHIGQHAWTVVRLGQEQFVLETTTGYTRGDALPELLPVSEVAYEYQPEQLFDRRRLYFRESSKTGPQPCLDYWGESDWPPVAFPGGAP